MISLFYRVCFAPRMFPAWLAEAPTVHKSDIQMPKLISLTSAHGIFIYSHLDIDIDAGFNSPRIDAKVVILNST